jgi:hypothetical protein
MAFSAPKHLRSLRMISFAISGRTSASKGWKKPNNFFFKASYQLLATKQKLLSSRRLLTCSD